MNGSTSLPYSTEELLDFTCPMQLDRLLTNPLASAYDENLQQISNVYNRRLLYELHRELYEQLRFHLPGFDSLRLDMHSLSPLDVGRLREGKRMCYRHLYFFTKSKLAYEVVEFGLAQKMRTQASSLSYAHQHGVTQQLLPVGKELYLVHASHPRWGRGQIRGVCGKPPEELSLEELVRHRRKLKLLTTSTTRGKI